MFRYVSICPVYLKLGPTPNTNFTVRPCLLHHKLPGKNSPLLSKQTYITDTCMTKYELTF